MIQKPPLPREHGAWVMLAVPLLLGNILAPSWHPRSLLLILAVFSGFLARHPLSYLIKTRSRKRASRRKHQHTQWFLIYTSFSMLAGGILLLVYRLDGILVFALVMLLCLALDMLYVSLRKSMSVQAESIGVFGLALCAPMSMYVASGQVSMEGFLLGMLVALYFVGSILYIRLKARRQPRMPAPTEFWPRCLAASDALLYHLVAFVFVVAFAVTGWLPLWTPVAFLPVTLKAIWGGLSWQDKQSLSLKKLGMIECIHAVLFCGLVYVAFG